MARGNLSSSQRWTRVRSWPRKSAGISMSLTIPRSILIAGRKTSVRLENAFWVGLQEIADKRLMTLPGLIAAIDAQRQHPNRSSALRLFVLEYYRSQVAERSCSEPPTRVPITGALQG